MAILEEASAKEEEADYEEEEAVRVDAKNTVWDGLKKFFTSKYAGYAGSAAAAAAVTLISTVAVSTFRKGGLR